MNRFLAALVVMALSFSTVSSQEATSSASVPADPVADGISKLKAKDPMVRRQGAESLGMLRDVRAVSPLISALKDESPFVRMAAVDSLGLLRASAATKNIGEILLNDKESQIRQSAAVSLGYIGSQDGAPYLISAIKDKDAGVRYAAVASLGQIRVAEAAPALESALKDADTGMKRSIISALDRMDSESSVPVVRPLLNDADDSVRALAAKFLGRFKDAESKQAISERLKDSNDMVVINSAYALGRLGDASGLQAVSKIVKSDKNLMTKIAAVEALEAIGTKEAVNLLRELMNSQEEDLKNSAKYALIRMKVPLEAPKQKSAPAKETPKKK